MPSPNSALEYGSRPPDRADSMPFLRKSAPLESRRDAQFDVNERKLDVHLTRAVSRFTWVLGNRLFGAGTPTICWTSLNPRPRAPWRLEPTPFMRRTWLGCLESSNGDAHFRVTPALF
jgi:hypothetical protein